MRARPSAGREQLATFEDVDYDQEDQYLTMNNNDSLMMTAASPYHGPENNMF